MIKKYLNFINEANIEDIFDPAYLKKLETEELESLGLISGDTSQISRIGGKIGSDLKKCDELIKMEVEESKKVGRELSVSTESEKLAKQIIESIYGDLLERYQITLNLKLISPVGIKQFIKNKKRQESNEESQMNLQKYKEITDQNLKNEIYRRKIANLIIQAKAKGIKSLLDNPIVSEGINKIFPKHGNDILQIWKDTSLNAHKLDLLSDPKKRHKMMELDVMSEGPNESKFLGATYISWKPKEESGGEEEYSEYTGEESEEDMFFMEIEETPVINSVGVDFSMLLHETVKGIFEFLAVPSIPEDEDTAATVRINTGLADEPEDWKYGPMIARKLEEFVKQNTRIYEIPNLVEEFFRDLLDKDSMPSDKFLSLIKGMLEKTKEARRIVDEMIDNIIYDLTPQSEEEILEPAESEGTEIQKLQSKESNVISQITQAASNPSKFSVTQLQDLLQKAAEFEEYEKAAKIRDYLNK